MKAESAAASRWHQVGPRGKTLALSQPNSPGSMPDTNLNVTITVAERAPSLRDKGQRRTRRLREAVPMRSNAALKLPASVDKHHAVTQ